MSDYQFTVGSVTFGTLTRYKVSKVTGLGSPGWRDGDVDVAGNHGALPTVDYLNKRTITFEMMAVGRNPLEAVRLARELQEAWVFNNADTPGATMALTAQLPSFGGPLRYFGRPRDFEPDYTTSIHSAVGIVCSFVAHDPLVYGTDTVVTLNLSGAVSSDYNGVAQYADGILAPLVAPLTTTANPAAPGGSVTPSRFLNLGGTRPTWPTIMVTGPCLGPRVSVGGVVYSFPELTVPVDSVLLIETHPARRSVTLDGMSVYTSIARGSRLRPISPGNAEIQFSSRTYDARATATVTARPALAA